MKKKAVIEMLEAKLQCLIRDTSGTDQECNRKECCDCDLLYLQGNMGEQIECLKSVIGYLKETTESEAEE